MMLREGETTVRTAERGASEPSVGGLPPRTVVVATTVGGILGAGYLLSPSTMWFALIAAGLLAWAARGLPPQERRWVLGVLIVAVLLRVLVVAGLFLTHDGDRQLSSFFFDGDGLAYKIRASWIRAYWLNETVNPFEAAGAFSHEYGWSSYLYVLAYLQYLLGPAPFGVHLFNIACFVAGAIIMHRFVRERFGRLTAFAGLVSLLCLPTLFLWSVSALKESFQFLFIVITFVSALEVLRRQPWRRRLLAAGALGLSMAVLGTVRQVVLMLTVAAIGLGILASFVVRRRYLAIACPILLVLVGWILLQQDGVQAQAISALNRAVSLHTGHVRTPGHGYLLLDSRFYSLVEEGRAGLLTESVAFRFMTKGIVSFFVVPFPWDVISVTELVFIPAQFIWYGMWLLMIVGLSAGMRRDALVTATIVMYAVLGAAIIGPSNGNVGTLIRIRDLVTPIVVWLAALGAVSLLGRLAVWRAQATERSTRTREVDGTRPVAGVGEVARESLGEAIRSSAVLRWCRKLAHESWLCRGAVAVFSRHTAPVDVGVSHIEDALALQYLRELAAESRFIRVPLAWLGLHFAAWRDAGITDFASRHVGERSVPQRVRLLGITLAAATVVAAVQFRFGGADGSASGWSLSLIVFLLGLALIVFSEPVSAAWDEWRCHSLSDRLRAGDRSQANADADTGI